jgi:hypothetical protein
MKASQEDITKGNKLRRRFFKMDFGGIRYTKMLKSMPEHVMYAKKLENHPEEMKFH